MESYVVPEATWAVFPCTVETIGKTEVQAITKWLSKSDYRPLNSGYMLGRMNIVLLILNITGKVAQ